VLSSCFRLRLTNRWPVPQEAYRQEPFLDDEDRIGGSAICANHIVWMGEDLGFQQSFK